MTREDIDRLLDACQSEAAKGEPDAAPGAIYFNSSQWSRMSMADLPTTCVSAGVGIRYRGVRVLVSSQFENRVATRGESGDAGQPFQAIEPSAAA
jgi:hypothetical protein